MRLECAKLKRRTKAANDRMPAEFLELVAPQVAPSESGLTECDIELEGPRGKMRVRWKGAATPDLAGLGRGLWESAWTTPPATGIRRFPDVEIRFLWSHFRGTMKITGQIYLSIGVSVSAL